MTIKTIGIVGRKAGMSRLFTEDGRSIPVTVIEASPNRITQIKTVETDGYTAVQITAGSKRSRLVNKPQAGHFAKAKVEAGRGLWEFRIEDKDAGPRVPGQEDGGPHGLGAAEHAEPRSGQGRRRARPDRGEGFGSGRAGRRCRRPSREQRLRSN